jgi:hypothetical protein
MEGGHHKDKITSLETALDSASRSLSERDSVLTGILEFIDAIERNLNEIRNRESMLSLQPEEFRELPVEFRRQMIDDLQKINELMKENKARIASLTASLKSSKSGNGRLQHLVEELRQNMEAREKELQKLNDEVSYLLENNQLLKSQNDSLIADNNSRKETIAQQYGTIEQLGSESSSAYFAAGTVRELEMKNIIEREGGFLGLGGVEQLKYDLELSNLTHIDIRFTQFIPIHSKKAEVITYHPKDSYQMLRNERDNIVDKIVILDPDKFWESSRCLVVVTK